MEDAGPHRMDCADLGRLDYLPAGEAILNPSRKEAEPGVGGCRAVEPVARTLRAAGHPGRAGGHRAGRGEAPDRRVRGANAGGRTANRIPDRGPAWAPLVANSPGRCAGRHPASMPHLAPVGVATGRGWHDVAPRATVNVMSVQPEISQRDLRMRSKEIMDAVERGQSFTVTRDGHEIGELVPLRRRRRFVSRAEFAETSRAAPEIDLTEFRADQDAAYDQGAGDPYAR